MYVYAHVDSEVQRYKKEDFVCVRANFLARTMIKRTKWRRPGKERDTCVDAKKVRPVIARTNDHVWDLTLLTLEPTSCLPLSREWSIIFFSFAFSPPPLAHTFVF
jgi:hypothetical protein